MPTIVRFNRKFTESQLSTACSSAATSIDGTNLADGTWYIPKYVTSGTPSTPNALYVGVPGTTSGTAILKKVADLTEAVLTGEGITDLINNYITSAGSSAHLISKVTQATNDGSGDPITSTYVKVDGTNVMTAPLTVGESGFYQANYGPNSIVNEQGREILGWDSSGYVNIAAGSDLEHVEILNAVTIDMSGIISGVATPADSTDAANKYYVDTVVSSTIGHLDGTITKTAGSASASTAANSYQKVPVVSGFVLKEVDGKLVETNAASGPSTVSTVDVDAAGSAQKALADAKNYADSTFLPIAGGTMTGSINMNNYSITGVTMPTGANANTADAATRGYVDDKITGLGTIMTFKGTQATEAALKALTNQKKGWVYVVTADGSEWVCTDDIGSTADPSKWEKFGTTDVQGALYKGDNVFTNETLVIADGTAGKMKAVTDADVATRLADETAFTGKYKVLQTAVQDTAVTGKYISEIDQDTQGVITITRADLPSGSGSVGTASSDAGAWKTVVHDVSLSGHTLSGNTKSIPAATSSADGYMTSSQASTVDAAVTSVDGVSASSHSINTYASCPTGSLTAAKTATITSGTTPNPLTAGTRVAVKFTYTNTANNPTLNINSSGAKNIYVNGAQITTGSNKGMLKGVCIFIYDGTQWHLIGGGSEYTAGGGLTLTDHTFSVSLEMGGGLLIDSGTGNISVGVDTESYNEDSTTDAWKRPVIVDSSEDGPYLHHSSDYLIVSGNYANIPAATGGANGNDGYMTVTQATNLNTAMLALTWEE